MTGQLTEARHPLKTPLYEPRSSAPRTFLDSVWRLEGISDKGRLDPSSLVSLKSPISLEAVVATKSDSRRDWRAVLLLLAVMSRPIVLVFLLVVLIITSQFEWKQQLVNDMETSSSVSQKQSHLMNREEVVKEKKERKNQTKPY
ncbi:hypothetical protein M5K25_023914 [Dendrobium thyrsiflorum]|uniref:Uncharacterized protein n=1 Tax=Dendrobium thyrsiflorum TaxID=117978 RepID=A0ABD0U0N8_DENTH